MSRTKKLLFATVACTAMMGALPAAAQQRCGEAINYEDADIRTLVDEIALRTGKKFVLDPRVQGRVTVKSGPNGQVCPDEAWELFQAALRVIGFTATPINGNSYKIVPVQEGSRAAGPVGPGVAGDIVTQIVRLNHIDAREAAANLSQIVNERGVVAPVRSGNAVIVVDTADNVERLRAVLAQIDLDTTVYRTIPLNHASATEVARVVSGLAQEISDEGGQQSSVSVVPVEASNSVLIRAEPSMIGRLINVIGELDRVGQSQADLSVIKLNHADAEELAPLLREIANASGESAGGEGAVISNGRQRATISFHKPTNSIIISGDANIQQRLRDVITQLDVRLAQVLIEAIIVEVTDDTARELGIQYFLTGSQGNSGVPFSATNFSSAQPNILAAAGAALLNSRDSQRQNGTVTTVTNPNGQVVTTTDPNQNDALTGIAGGLAQTAINSLVGANGFSFGGVAEFGDGNFFGGILTALKEDNETNVLSFPSVVTLDNQEASLSVGQEIPITTGEAVGDNFSNAFRTVSREEVGVILTVTPQINEGGTVMLEIEQEISSVQGQVLSTSTDLITNKRQISTTALVDDGDILVIGGLVEQAEELVEEKVPLLGDIPFAGNLFKTTARSKDRSNLMIFIRPTIIRNRKAAGDATRKKFDYIRAREILTTGDPTSGMEMLIDQVTGTLPPASVEDE